MTASLLASAIAALPVLSAEQPAPPPSTAPSPAEKNPLSTTTEPNPSTKPGEGTAMPAPEKSLAPPAPPGTAPQGSPAPPARGTLVPTPGEANEVDEVTLPAKPAAILPGQATWEQAVPSLKASFRRIEDALAKIGVRPTGRPLAVFTKTEESGFEYEAMVPVEAAPGTSSVEALRFGTTPSGKALRFKHLGPYDDIDGTYETFTAYLDAKEIAVQDRFVEEYATDLTDGTDEKLDINIYALAK